MKAPLKKASINAKAVTFTDYFSYLPVVHLSLVSNHSDGDAGVSEWIINTFLPISDILALCEIK